MPRFAAIAGPAVVVALASAVWSQNTLSLTLEEAHSLTLKNNPLIASSMYSAQAAAQVPKEIGSAFQPNLTGAVTGVGADSGSRIAAGTLNNPVLYNHAGTGLTLNQLLTDFGRTHSLVGSARLQAQAQTQVLETTRAQALARDRSQLTLTTFFGPNQGADRRPADGRCAPAFVRAGNGARAERAEITARREFRERQSCSRRAPPSRELSPKTISILPSPI